MAEPDDALHGDEVAGARRARAQRVIAPAAGIDGHPSGTSADSEDTLSFCRITGARPMIETRPLEQAGEAYERMMSGDARFRMVLTTGSGPDG